MLDSNQIADLISENHKEWLPRLLAIANTKIGPLTWKGEKRGAIPGGSQAEDFVSEAVEKTIDGKRCFNHPGGPEAKEALFNHLQGAVCSLISHACECSENKLVRNTLSEENPDTGLIPEIPDSMTPLDRLIATNDKKCFQTFLLTFVDYIDDDPKLKEAFQLFFDGATPEEVSKKLKLGISETYQLRRKIKRRIDSFGKERMKVVMTKGGPDEK